MLTYLAIKNFAIIHSLEVELQSGMTVITGETGAGKSLLIDTLGLALGDRADSSMIKSGATKCEITAIFDTTHLPAVKEWLQNNALDLDNNDNNSSNNNGDNDDNNGDSDNDNSNTSSECIIYRSCTKDGRSRSNINGIPCTLQMLKDLGNLLIDIHSQHEHHSLLKTETQRTLLDAYANNEDLCSKLRQIYTTWQKLQKIYSTLATTTQDSVSKVEFLNYQLQELESFSVTALELEKIKQEHSLLSNAEEIMQLGQTVLASATNVASDRDGDEHRNILAQLHTTKNHLEKIAMQDARIANVCSLWDSAIISIEESVDELKHYLEHIELNREKLTTLEERLQKIYAIARKHKVKPEELSSLCDNLKTQFAELQTADEKLVKLQLEINAYENTYQDIAQQISAARHTAATMLAKLVTKKMHELGMPDGIFKISINALPDGSRLTPQGLENIEFQVSANAGQSLQPLHKVASGGELSRISLALQVILTNRVTVPTVIFDEVDVGIGGKTAEIVGKLLHELSAKNQVICITHLPQVASYGTHHLLVEKHAATTHTTTTLNIAALNTQQARAQEIARMLGGINITKRTLAHAEEMLEKADI